MPKILRKISIDFAQRNAIDLLREATTTTWIMAIFAIGSGYFMTTNLIQKQSLLNETATVIKQINQKAHFINQTAAPKTSSPSFSPDEIIEINHAIDDLNMPWSDFFDAIETINFDVAILSIEPNLSKNLIRISAESKDHEHMLKFLTQMRDSRHFRNSLLAKYEFNEVDTNRPIRFSIETSWVKGSSK